MELNKVIEVLEKKYPVFLKEEWDNVGLILGETFSEVRKVMITLDVTEKTVDMAVKEGCNVIISHHPLIFKPLSGITNRTLTGKKILKLIQNNIALYTIHTNADSAMDGLNSYIAAKIGGENVKIADIRYHDVVKIAVFSPKEYEVIIKEKIKKISKFSDNGYSGVIYATETREDFNGNGADVINKETVKIEFLAYRQQVRELIAEIKKVHPYEEPAYEIIEIDKRFQAGGIGRVFALKESMEIEEYLKLIKGKLNLKAIKAVYEKGVKVKKIGIVNGSGMSFFKKMKDNNVDLFITADIKYHEALDAKEYGIALADIGHYESEIIFCEMLGEEIDKLGIEYIIYNDEPVFSLI